MDGTTAREQDMRYMFIGLLAWPLIFCLAPFIGRWSWAVAALAVTALWSIAWRVQWGSWKFWGD